MTTFISNEDFKKFDKADIISLVVGSIFKKFSPSQKPKTFCAITLFLFDKLKKSSSPFATEHIEDNKSEL